MLCTFYIYIVADPLPPQTATRKGIEQGGDSVEELSWGVYLENCIPVADLLTCKIPGVFPV